MGDLSQVPDGVRGRTVPATVPGCIHTDLMDAGLIPDPAVGMNEKEVQWVSWTDWRYECEFEADPALFTHHEIDLNFECLDTIASIELNGIEVGKAASEFIPWRFGVLGNLKPGRNTLAVTFTSPLRHVHEMAATLGRRPHNGDEQGWAPFNLIRKCASNFGWDWGPRVATCGITGEITLEGWSEVRISQVRSYTVRDQPLEDLWTIDAHVDLVWSIHTQSTDRYSITCNLKEAGVPFEGDRCEVVPGVGSSRLQMEVLPQSLWHPVGFGPPQMFDLVFDVVGGAQQPHTKADHLAKIGFHDRRLKHGEKSLGSRFEIVCNGQPTFIKGANWIPEGLWPRDRTPQRVRQRLQQVLDANMNMIRVWGGGRYEPDWFYDLCDEMGIMVWQDFMFACACYPEEEPLRSLIEREARYQVARLSRHPSVVLWCGGNECHWAYESWGFKERLAASRSPQTWGKHYWREMLPSIVAELSPGTPYWTDSPYSSSFGDHQTNSPDTGDRHTWDAWGDGYRTIVPRFCSEFGQQSPSSWRTLEEAELLAGVASTSPDRQGGVALPSALAARQLGPGGNARWYDDPMREWFREPRDLNEWHAMAQMLQARSLRIGIEWMRVNRPRCMGTLVWQLNDAWPGLSWSLIDSAGHPKLAYEAVRQAFAPVLLTIQPIDGRLRLCLACDELGPEHPVARVRRLRLDGTVIAEAINVQLIPFAHGVHRDVDIESLVGTAADLHDEFIVADVEGHRATWFFAPDRLVHFRPPVFDLERCPSIGDATLVKLTAKSVLRDLWIDEGRLPGMMRAELSSPLRTLLPGERTYIRLCMEGAREGVPASLDVAAILRSPVLRSASDWHARSMSH